MAGSDRSSAETWKQWLDTQFAAHAALKQQDFAAAVGVGNSAVSKWRKGANPPGVDTAIDAADFFDRSPQEALRAAGHFKMADLLDKVATEPVQNDPFVEEIMSWRYLGADVREALLEQYQASREANREQARKLAARLRDNENGDAA